MKIKQYKKTALISIVIPCFNQGAYIREALDSVNAQIYADREIIIVNDGSDDEDTIKVLQELRAEGYRIIDTANEGVSAARNTGIASAKGEYILPLDADDVIAPEYLSEAVRVLDASHTIKLVYCNAEYFGAVKGPMLLPKFSFSGMLSENLIFNAAVFRKKDFDATEKYDPAFLTGWEDWEFWLRFIKDEKEVYKLPGIYFFYRRKESSRNASLTEQKLQRCEQQLYKKHIGLFLENDSAPISMIKEYAFYKNEFEKLSAYREELHRSASYRLGNALLSPFKAIKKLFTK